MPRKTKYKAESTIVTNPPTKTVNYNAQGSDILWLVHPETPFLSCKAFVVNTFPDRVQLYHLTDTSGQIASSLTTLTYEELTERQASKIAVSMSYIISLVADLMRQDHRDSIAAARILLLRSRDAGIFGKVSDTY